MPIPTKRLQAITLRHQIAARIRQSILDGSLAPGERLVERNVADQLGASVTAVREAVIQLESEGLITKRSNSTTHITALTREEIRQTFAVRRNLESLAIAEAAWQATPGDLRQLKTLHQDAIAAASQKDPRRYIQCDFEWHQAVWGASKNDVLAAALQRLVLPLFGFSAIQVVSQPGFDLAEDAKTHAPILRAIARKDSAGAVAAFERSLVEWSTHVREQPSGKRGKERDACSAKAGD